MLKLSETDAISSIVCGVLAVMLVLRFGEPKGLIDSFILFMIIYSFPNKTNHNYQFVDVRLWIILNSFILLLCAVALVQLVSGRPLAYVALAAGLTAASSRYLRLYQARSALDRHN
jgi:hypothetical protein